MQNVCHRIKLSENSVWFSKELTPPNISERGSILFSNSTANNQWYLGDEKISGETNPFFEPKESGMYTLEVTHDQCRASATYDFIFQDEQVRCFPNPVAEMVTVISPKEEFIRQVSVVDCWGKQIAILQPEEESKSIHFKFPDAKPGIYFLVLTTNRRKYSKKIVKN